MQFPPGLDQSSVNAMAYQGPVQNSTSIGRFFTVNHWMKSVLAPAVSQEGSQPHAHGGLGQTLGGWIFGSLAQVGFGLLIVPLAAMLALLFARPGWWLVTPGSGKP